MHAGLELEAKIKRLNQFDELLHFASKTTQNVLWSRASVCLFAAVYTQTTARTRM